MTTTIELRQANHGIAIRLLNPDGDIVARVINPEYVDDGKGNYGGPNAKWLDGVSSGEYANLFCAAPELLALAEMVVKFTGHQADGNMTPITNDELYQMAKKAVSKARPN